MMKTIVIASIYLSANALVSYRDPDAICNECFCIKFESPELILAEALFEPIEFAICTISI